MIVRTVTSLLGTGDWLRYLTLAALPRRPNGSAIVAVTETAVAIADLDHTFRITRRLRVESTELTGADLVPRRRLGLLGTADIHLHTTTDPGIKLLGLFREQADAPTLTVGARPEREHQRGLLGEYISKGTEDQTYLHLVARELDSPPCRNPHDRPASRRQPQTANSDWVTTAIR